MPPPRISLLPLSSNPKSQIPISKSPCPCVRPRPAPRFASSTIRNPKSQFSNDPLPPGPAPSAPPPEVGSARRKAGLSPRVPLPRSALRAGHLHVHVQPYLRGGPTGERRGSWFQGAPAGRPSKMPRVRHRRRRTYGGVRLRGPGRSAATLSPAFDEALRGNSAGSWFQGAPAGGPSMVPRMRRRRDAPPSLRSVGQRRAPPRTPRLLYAPPVSRFSSHVSLPRRRRQTPISFPPRPPFLVGEGLRALPPSKASTGIWARMGWGLRLWNARTIRLRTSRRVRGPKRGAGPGSGLQNGAPKPENPISGRRRASPNVGCRVSQVRNAAQDAGCSVSQVRNATHGAGCEVSQVRNGVRGVEGSPSDLRKGAPVSECASSKLRNAASGPAGRPSKRRETKTSPAPSRFEGPSTVAALACKSRPLGRHCYLDSLFFQGVRSD